jgi:TfoX/Sxy family transcriptional regulator of competence genes
MPRVSEEVRVFSEFLLQELLKWPNVTARPMFGLKGVYKGKTIFAALPATRALNTSCSVSFKLRTKTPATVKALEGDERIVRSELRTHSWISFEIRSDRDIPDAVEWFARAYKQAAKSTPEKPKGRTTRR